MTEYDYSPGAWERYKATQHRVGNWVDTTHRYEPANPFVSTSPALNTGGFQGDDYFSSSSSSSRHHRHSRQHSHKPSTDYRTYAEPRGMQPPQMPYGSPYPSVNHSISSSSSRHPGYSTSGASSRRSRSSKPTYIHVPPPISWIQAPVKPVASIPPVQATLMPSSSNSNSYPSTPMTSPRSGGHSSLSGSCPIMLFSSYGQGLSYTTVYPNPRSPTIIEQPSHMPVVVPIDGGQGGYIVVPPKGKRMDIANPNYGYKQSASRQPFFKKLLNPFKARRY